MVTRYIAGAKPVAVVTVLMAVMHRRRLILTATIIAALCFGVAMASAMGIGSVWLHRSPMNWLAPLPNEQHPAEEVGLLPLADALIEIIKPAQKEGTEPQVFTVLTGPGPIEVKAISLALRQRSQNRWSPIRIRPCGLGSEKFIIKKLCNNQWFLIQTGPAANSQVGQKDDKWT
jgi:hypothetical protein